jgi:hypothetical protein
VAYVVVAAAVKAVRLVTVAPVSVVTAEYVLFGQVLLA